MAGQRSDATAVLYYTGENTMSLSSGGASSMEEIFQSFCSFGGGMKDSPPMMDGSKFGKFCRDMKILDKKLMSTDVDIIFAQVKG